MNKKIPLKGKLFVIAIIIIIFFGGIASQYLTTNFSAQENNPFPDSKINVLITGHDDDHYGVSRTDTIILASIDIETRQAGLVFIPRDTRVSIPGRGINRINSAYAFGGIDLTIETIEDFLDINIDYYADLDFDGFIKIIDAIGGVDINVERDLDYVDRAGDLNISIPAGQQTLDGENALDYVRYRESSRGDIGRVERQQKFVNAVISQALSPSTIARLPSIYQEINRAVDTNIPLIDISSFLFLAKDIDLNNLETAMVPGSPEYIGGASYWVPDQEETEALVHKLIHSKEYIANNQTDLVISNGNGTAGVAGNLANELERFGFNIKRITNADHFNYEETEIRYYSDEKRPAVNNLLNYIGGEAIFIDNEEEDSEINKSKIEIIIGHDFLERDQEEEGV
ncbi:LCP family protein [Halanaerobiaceae bacterium Z-7014]|uniref:LCP family protein n=1 Tax=Halonatronomonas betaini TaxID=2778430 RepID=A0A931AND6_9FIRM|nr:LCP family protein [Halonatronomonas betaini]MBF8435993.1 LCP family protein [Halonatronomonas betaini]